MRTYLRMAWIVSGVSALLGVASAACLTADEPTGAAEAKAGGTEVKVDDSDPLSALVPFQLVGEKDDALTRGQKERYNAALSQVTSQRELFKLGTESLGSTLEPLERLSRSAEPVLKRDEYLRLLEECVKIAKSLEAAAKVRHEGGFGSTAQVHDATYVRADLEIRWLEAKKAAGKK